MATSGEFVEYVCGQLSGAGQITSKKMFGEYGVYCDGKIVALICDDQFFVKQTEKGRAVILKNGQGEVVLESPYEGSKPYFLIEDLENADFLAELLRASYEELPMQKPRKKKADKEIK